jgi:hypothetical protein
MHVRGGFHGFYDYIIDTVEFFGGDNVGRRT